MELNFIEASSTLHRALVCATQVLMAFYIFFNSRSTYATMSFFFLELDFYKLEFHVELDLFELEFQNSGRLLIIS